jgi:lysozyme
MKINEAGLALLKSFEGCRLTAYRDAVGVWTIGWGQTGDWIHSGLEISQGRADELLAESLAKFETGVESLAKVPVNSNEFSALVCFAYNVGLDNLKKSTLLNCLNKHNRIAAGSEFLKWTKAKGIELPGLVRRRQAEKALFLTPVDTRPI